MVLLHAPAATGAAVDGTVVAGAAVVWVKRGWQLAVALASATAGLVPFTVYLMSSVDAAATPRLDSYFLLKVAGGLVVLATPIVIAYVASVLAAGTEDVVQRLGGNPNGWRAGLVACGAGGLAASFGLLASPSVPNGFPQAPGFAAYQQRIDLVANDAQGPQVLQALRVARQNPDRTALIWDNNGVLLTSWLQALLGVRSNGDIEVAEAIGIPPSGEPPVAEFNRLIREQPRLQVLLFWIDPGVFNPLQDSIGQLGMDRIRVQQLT